MRLTTIFNMAIGLNRSTVRERIILPFSHISQRQLKQFEDSGDYLKVRQFIDAKYGPWPETSKAADRAAMEAHISAQEAFIQNGYYPWDEPLETGESWRLIST